MVEPTEHSSPTDSKLDIRLGCAVAAFLPLSCILGTIVQSLFAISIFGPSYSYLSQEVRNSAFYSFLYSAAYTMSGAIPFSLLVTGFHAHLLVGGVPGSAHRRWIVLTALGAVASWLIFWTLWEVILGGSFEYFEALFRRSEDSLPSTLGAILLVSAAGAALTAASAFPLAVIIGLAIRRHVPNSLNRILLVVVLSSIFTGLILSFYMWGTRWGWN
jgi:hypothetical protein